MPPVVDKLDAAGIACGLKEATRLLAPYLQLIRAKPSQGPCYLRPDVRPLPDRRANKKLTIRSDDFWMARHLLNGRFRTK